MTYRCGECGTVYVISMQFGEQLPGAWRPACLSTRSRCCGAALLAGRGETA